MDAIIGGGGYGCDHRCFLRLDRRPKGRQRCRRGRRRRRSDRRKVDQARQGDHFPSFISQSCRHSRDLSHEQLPPGTTPADAMATETERAQLDAAYDNSKAFSRFLKSSALSDVFREMTLKRRLRHKILPQVRRVPPLSGSDLVTHAERWRVYMPTED